MFDPKKILVLAPHTDDGELGCGATLAKFCGQGKEVHYIAFSSCRRSLPEGFAADTLEKECKAATKEIGISNTVILDFEVREFPAKRQEILETLVKLNKEIQPDLVFIPSANDVHQDHQVIHAEARRAFKNSSLLGYELPWNQQQFNSTFFSPVSNDNLNKKITALKAYRSQAHRNYMQEDFIRSLAKVRGVQCNNEFAEAFEVYKIISH